MKRIIELIAVIILFASCQKGGTYYCREYSVVDNVMTIYGEPVKKTFISYDAMIKYSENNKMWCEKK